MSDTPTKSEMCDFLTDLKAMSDTNHPWRDALEGTILKMGGRIEELEREVAELREARPIMAEVARAVAKFPTWPTDPLHALAVLGEEFGELTKAMVQLTYEPHKTSADEVRTEALQTAAMALRLYHSLGKYDYRPSPQHEQAALKGKP